MGNLVESRRLKAKAEAILEEKGRATLDYWVGHYLAQRNPDLD